MATESKRDERLVAIEAIVDDLDKWPQSEIDRALRFEGTWPTPPQLEAAARPWNKPNRKPAR